MEGGHRHGGGRGFGGWGHNHAGHEYSTRFLGKVWDSENLPPMLDGRIVDPAKVRRGAQGTLKHLGFYSGPLDGRDSAALKLAIKKFQGSSDLPTTGIADAGTIASLGLKPEDFAPDSSKTSKPHAY